MSKPHREDLLFGIDILGGSSKLRHALHMTGIETHDGDGEGLGSESCRGSLAFATPLIGQSDNQSLSVLLNKGVSKTAWASLFLKVEPR